VSKIESNVQLILIKREAAYGVDIVPTEVDAILVRDFKLEPDIGMVELPHVGPTRRSRGAHVGRVAWKVSFSLDAVGTTVLNVGDVTAPKLKELLEACEMAESDVGAGPITGKRYDYTSRQDSPSVTIYVVRFKRSATLGDHDITKIPGVRLTHTLKAAVGEAITFDFEGMGLFVGKPAPGALDLGALTFSDESEDDDSAPSRGITFTIGGVSRETKSFELSPLRSTPLREALTGTYGVAEVEITAELGKSFLLKLSEPLEFSTDYDQTDLWLTEALEALVIVIDSVGGARLTITANELQRGSFSYEPDNGTFRIPQECYLRDETNAADDAVRYEFSITP
jgi:hypothetical protein